MSRQVFARSRKSPGAVRLAVVVVLASCCCAARPAAALPPSNVPPTEEIEVLDPGVDPEGKPSIQLRRGDEGQLEVDIPPTVLVHRYYYTGDRSFQAQLLPGGPTIICVNHPKTGERCYVEAQMPPGAPRVTYCGSSITYDYGHGAVCLHFGLLGRPSVHYRSGRTMTQVAGDVVHAEELGAGAKLALEHGKTATKRAAVSMYGAAAIAGSAAHNAALPVIHVAQALPFGRVLFSGEMSERLQTRAAQQWRDHKVQHAERERRRDEWTIGTNIR